MKAVASLLFFLAAVGGSLAGILTNIEEGRAVDDYEVYVNPGGDSNALTCGFHVVCRTPYPDTNRTALDWGNNPTTLNDVYWRSFGYKGIGSQSTIATGQVWNYTSDCNEVAVEIYSLASSYRGSERYVHTALVGSDGRTFYIPGSTTGAYKLEGPIGATVADEEDEDCDFDGPHLHQGSELSGWFRNSNVYPDEPSTGTGYSLTDGDNWQNRRPWSE
jgi:hypothetical protein